MALSYVFLTSSTMCVVYNSDNLLSNIAFVA